MENRQYQLAPSVYASDFMNLREQVTELESAKVDLLHFDVMDGQFVEKIAFSLDHLRALRAITRLPIEAHLMVERPEQHIEAMAAAGADIVVIHVEATSRILSCLHKIRRTGAQAGLALSPATSEEAIRYVLDDLDKVIVMSVNPGEEGQSFLHSVLPKIRRISEIIANRPIDIGVDGSIDAETIKLCANAGANVFVSGGYLFDGPVETKINALRAALA